MLARVSKGVFAIIAGQVVGVLETVVLVPLFLIHWSPTLYGEWLTLWSTVAYLSTLDLGINMAVVNRLTQAHARGDLNDYRRHQNSAFAFYVTVSVAAFAAALPVIYFLSIAKWLNLREISELQAKWVVFLLMLLVLVGLPTSLVVCSYRTIGHLSISEWISTARRFATVCLTGLVLWKGGQLESVATLQLMVFTATALLVAASLKARRPRFYPGFSAASLSTVKSLLAPSLFFMLIMMANVISQQGPIMLVALKYGGLAVALLATSRTLANLLRQLVGAINASVWPEVTAMEARRDWDRLRALHRILVFGSTAVGLGIAAALWHEGPALISAWTRGRITPDPILLRLLLLHLALSLPWMASSVFSASSNRHANLSKSYLFSALIALGVTACLLDRAGLYAVPLGLIVGDCLACYHFVLKDTCRLIGENYGRFALRCWSGFWLVASVAVLSGLEIHEVMPGLLIARWIAVGVVTTVMAVLTAWLICFSARDRSYVMDQLRALVARKLAPAKIPAVNEASDRL